MGDRRQTILGVGLFLLALGLIAADRPEARLPSPNGSSVPGVAGPLPDSGEPSLPSKSDRRAGPKLALRERLIKSGQLTTSDAGGWLLRDAALQDLFEVLSDEADLTFLPNDKLSGDEYLVNGHLNGEGGPRKQLVVHAPLATAAAR